MDSYEINRILGWVLAALVAVLSLSIFTGYLFPVNEPEQRAYVVAGVEEEAPAAGAAAETEKPIEFFLASADVARGEAQFRKCAACHTIERGGAQGIGPNLWGIIGARHAHIAGFNYSPAMQATADKVWDWQNMSEWLRNPRGYLPGNRMSFAGLGRPQDRADLLAFLNSMSDNPRPLPAPPAAEPAVAAQPAAEPAAA